MDDVTAMPMDVDGDNVIAPVDALAAITAKWRRATGDLAVLNYHFDNLIALLDADIGALDTMFSVLTRLPKGVVCRAVIDPRIWERPSRRTDSLAGLRCIRMMDSIATVTLVTPSASRR